MSAQSEKRREYYQGCNPKLLEAVPGEARVILDVGCGEGYLGAELKRLGTGRHVIGAERDPRSASRAASRLDRVFELDVEREDIELEHGSLDCILYGDVLEHLRDPRRVLARHRPLLRPDGLMLCSIPNIQHHSMFTALARGDFQYVEAGLLDATHLRFFTFSTCVKLLLDAGYVPSLADATDAPVSLGAFEALGPFLRRAGVDPRWAKRHLDAYQYIFRGTPQGLPAGESADGRAARAETPLTFVVAVSDEARLAANLLSSPCLGPGSPHEVIRMAGQRSAAEALNAGIARAQNEIVVCVHQDVYLPRGWTDRFAAQLELGRSFGPLGVAGVYGIAKRNGATAGVGRVIDRDRILEGAGGELPLRVETLDELLLAVPKGTPLRFDPRLGFHFYGADVCLEAKKQGLSVLALDALCFHNSLLAEYPDDFYPSGHAFALKWAGELPVTTTCAVVDRHWKKSRPRNWWWPRELARMRRKLSRRVEKWRERAQKTRLRRQRR